MLTLGFTLFFGEARQYFNRPEPYLKRIENLKEDIEKEKFKHLLTKYEFEDFRQYTATLIPDVVKEKGPGEKSYPVRTLASVVSRGDMDVHRTALAKDLFETCKFAFRNKSFDTALYNFDKVINEHSYSAHILEAFFLKIESHFQLRQYSQATRALDKMVELFPSHELTGYAMLRIGKIYEYQDRHDEAIRIYETVLQAFPDRNLASTARESLRAVEL